jgi:hypothetical protein
VAVYLETVGVNRFWVEYLMAALFIAVGVALVVAMAASVSITTLFTAGCALAGTNRVAHSVLLLTTTICFTVSSTVNPRLKTIFSSIIAS